MGEFIIRHWLTVLFGVIAGAFGAMFARVQVRINREKEETEAVKRGVQALLRDRIVQAYNHYMTEKGYCPIYALENIEDLYLEYKNLGGNGTVTKLVEDLKKLPTSGGDT